MNLLRHQIFSRAALAENQNGRIGRCNTVANFKRAPHLRRAANHSAELPFSRQLAPQRRIFFFQSGELQQIRQTLPQFVQLESLYQIVCRAHAQCFHSGLRRIQRGNDQHWQLIPFFA